MIGGEGGIRTPGTLARTPHFECGAIDHSATSPGPTAMSATLAAWSARRLACAVVARKARWGRKLGGHAPARRFSESDLTCGRDPLHGDMRHQRHGLAQLPGHLRIRGIAVERTLVDALVDRDAAEEVEGEEEGPIGNVLKPHSFAI